MKFGMEFEFSGRNIDMDTMRRILTAAVAEHDPRHQVSQMESFRLWTLKSEHCGMEITTPVFEASQATFDVVHDVIDHLRRELRGQRSIRRDCGMHVHLDVGTYTVPEIRNICKVFRAFEGALLKLQPPSRRENSYCARIDRHSASWIDSFNVDDPDQRYNRDGSFLYDHSSGINFGRFSDRGTLEIRYAAGTIRGMKAVGWLRTLLMMVHISQLLDADVQLNQTESVEDLKTFITENDTGQEWLENLKTRCCRWIDARNAEINTPPEQQGDGNGRPRPLNRRVRAVAIGRSRRNAPAEAIQEVVEALENNE